MQQFLEFQLKCLFNTELKEKAFCPSRILVTTLGWTSYSTKIYDHILRHCTKLVGHKIARLNRKSFFYFKKSPYARTSPLRPISTKGKFALHSFSATPISNVNQKG